MQSLATALNAVNTLVPGVPGEDFDP